MLRTDDVIATGAYADVFRPPQNPVVYKLFDSIWHPERAKQHLTQTGENERRRNTFLSECEAYVLAGLDPFLRNHIPSSFRRVQVSDVTKSTQSVAEWYLRDCCYEIEYLDGTATKYGHIKHNPPDHIRAALDLFRTAGIHYLEDVSIFRVDDPERFKFIDFAVKSNRPEPSEWR